MTPDLTWLAGSRVTGVGKTDYSWSLSLNDDAGIVTEGAWRLITPEGVAVTSEDHGQQFGLSTPVDAGRAAMAKIGGSVIDRFTLDGRTGDLSLYLEGDMTIEFLTLSSGYESWNAHHGNQRVICVGGGRLVELGES